MSSVAYAALWIFVFTLPWERVIVFEGLSIITRVTGALALGLTLPTVLISARLRRWRIFHVAALLFVLWAGVVLLVHRTGSMPPKYYTFVQLLLVLWMIWEIAPTRRHQTGLLLAYVLGAYVAAIETLLLFAREAGQLRRFAAGGSDPNTLAMTLALAIPMAWYLGTIYHRPLPRWACRAYLPIGLLAIGLTGSRGGMIASVVALLIVPLTMTHLSPGRMVTAIAILAISGVVAVHYVPETIVERLATTGESVQDRSLGGRFRLWKAGIHAFTERPFMGYGTSGFRAAIAGELRGVVQSAHNSYLSVLVEQGLIGLLLFLWMLTAVFVAIRRLPQFDRRFALVLFATLCVAMLPLTWEDQKVGWFTLAALIGLANAPIPVRQPIRQPGFRRPVPAGSPSLAARSMPRAGPPR